MSSAKSIGRPQQRYERLVQKSVKCDNLWDFKVTLRSAPYFLWFVGDEVARDAQPKIVRDENGRILGRIESGAAPTKYTLSLTAGVPDEAFSPDQILASDRARYPIQRDRTL